jgi:AcrR family transcriptional regulator
MGKRGPKRDQDAEQRILDATRDLICERGATRVSINEIAEHAGVSKPTIYRWWPSKAAVVFDALEREIKAGSPPPNTGTAYGDVRIQMQRVAKLMNSPLRAILRELIAETFGDDDVAEQFRTLFFAERRRQGAATVQAGIDRGELRPDLDLEVIGDLLYSPLWMRMIIGHQPLTPKAVDKLLDHVWPAFTPEA